MDAENRLQQLNVIRPKDNINLLNAKFRVLQHPRHARPILPQYRDDYVHTLYDQMGAYVQERSGLYHTETYDPTRLVQAMPELHNQMSYAAQNTSDLKDEYSLDDLLKKGEHIQDRTKMKSFEYKTIGDYQRMRVSYCNCFTYRYIPRERKEKQT
jgi:hypothetical protein